MKCLLYSYFFACFLASLLTPHSLSAQWQKLEAPGVTGVNYLVEASSQLFALRTFSGLWHSTDAGLTWQPVAASPLGVGDLYLTIDGDANQLAALILNDKNSELKAFVSNDGAQSWQALPAFPGTATFSDKIFVRDGHIYCYRLWDYNLYRYDSSTQTWVPLLNISGFLLDFGFNQNTIWAGSNNGLKFSPDLGATWQTITAPFTKVVSVDVDDNRVVVAAANGMFTSTNNGASWTPGTLPQTDLNTQIIADDGAFYAIFLNGGAYRSTDGFQTYQQVFTGLGGQMTWAVSNGYWLASAEPGLYRSPQDPAGWQWVTSPSTRNDNVSLQSAGGVLFYSGGQTAFSTDEGATWQLTADRSRFNNYLFHSGTWYATKDDGKLWSSANLTNWALQGNLPPMSGTMTYFGNTLVNIPAYAGLPVYTSTDNGVSWQPQGTMPGDSTITQHSFAYDNQIYFYQPGDLQRSADFGFTWQSLGPVLSADPNEVNSFLTTPGKIYAFSNENLQVSTDGGLNWTLHSLQPINPTQANISGRLAFNGGLLLRSPDYILYLTQDDGATWQPVMGGLTAVPSSQMVTTGNSVFVLDSKVIPWRRDNFVVNVAQYSGQVYRDLDMNGMFDAGEPGLPNAVLHLANSNQYTLTAANGAFTLFAEAQNDQLNVASVNKYCQFMPANYAVNATNTQLDFGLKCTPGITDLAVNLTNSIVFRPGFDTDLHLTVSNAGVETADGTVTLQLDPALTFVSANPTAVPVGNTLTWNVAGLASLDRLEITVRVQTPSLTPLGTVLNLTATATPNVTDYAPVDNMAEIHPVVVGSYDPNDKQVSQTAYSTADLGSARPLVYTIRFQNTGSFYASTVVVRDTLSANLDPGTVRVLSASHPFTWTLRGPGILEFRFDNIYLPDSINDEPGSHGYIQFSVGLRDNLPVGALTENTGHIYFDFNAPIVTNTVTTALVVSTREPLNIMSLRVFPNPASDYIRVDLPAGVAPEALSWGIFDAAGRLVRILQPDQISTGCAVSDLAPGLYRIWGRGTEMVYSGVFSVVR